MVVLFGGIVFLMGLVLLFGGIVFITGYGCYLAVWLFYFWSMAFIWGMVILFWVIVRPGLGVGQHG